jgi:maltose alpha-D-glucosyltransferase/alpha-amylase
MIGDLWYKNAIVYSLDLDTFMDANGDGVGDFAGLIRRLDYLATLGVDVLWLAPFQPSPNRDNGYDISDYYGVDARHGSSGDFVEFLRQAHGRGMKVIIDLVVNHTSDQHPWFQDARRSRSSPFRDWYVWSKKKPPGWNEGMVFPGEQNSTWTRDDAAKEYYFHRFYEFQPDLNMDNPEVRTEIRRVIGFWLQLGVDGFRVDAVPFLIESPTRDGSEPELHFEYLDEIRSFLEWRSGPAILLGEANVPPEESAQYFEHGRGIHMMFNFWVNQHLFYALATGDATPLAEAIEATREIPASAQWAQFLRNHDELDLGRLTEEQRQAVFARFAPDPSMQLYERGIRRRLAPMLGNRERTELAYSMLFSLPGTPVLRYGDEIGMGDDLELDQRDAVRTPMQWSGEPSAGFSNSNTLVHPIVKDGVHGAHEINVEKQRRDPGSLLRWTMRMIRVRKECPEIGWGTYEILDAGSPTVLALLFEWRGSAVLTLHNFDEKAQEAAFRIDRTDGTKLYSLLEGEDLSVHHGEIHRITVDGHGYRWYRVGSMNYALQRSAEIPISDAEPKSIAARKETKAGASKGAGKAPGKKKTKKK